MRSWIAMVLVAGCGDNLEVRLDFDPVVERADVSILYPLPTTIDQMIRPSEPAAFGLLFPERLFPTVIGPVDIGISYADMHLVALRFDPCSARDGCSSEVRAIFQPVILVDGVPTAADGAIHVFYELPLTELVLFEEQVLALKKSFGGGISYGSVLGVHPILAATGYDGEFAAGLHALVLDHLGESRIARFTEQNHQIPTRDRWDFYLFERVDGELVRRDIATTTADEEQVTGTPADPEVAGGIALVTPTLDTPLLALVDENRPAVATDQIRDGYARAIHLQDPTKEDSESTDCVSCHLAEGGRRIGTAEYGLTAMDAFENDTLGYQRDLGAVTNLRMFAYNRRFVSVTQRVANESSLTAAALQQLVAD